jgi:hypothetical protein
VRLWTAAGNVDFEDAPIEWLPIDSLREALGRPLRLRIFFYLTGLEDAQEYPETDSSESVDLIMFVHEGEIVLYRSTTVLCRRERRALDIRGSKNSAIILRLGVNCSLSKETVEGLS